MNKPSLPLELLTLEKIKIELQPENSEFLSNLEIFATIDSTNSYLLSCAKQGAPSGSVCFAETQTAGRGRLGRSWFSPPYTNLYCSMLWEFSKLPPGLSIAVAVIVLHALKKYGISEGMQLKWPNDILFAGRKLAGILLESSGSKVVIGVGVNVCLPEDADPAWISLQEITGNSISRNRLAGLLVDSLLTYLPIFQKQGLRFFLPDWQAHDVLKNKNITIHAAGKIFSGVMQGINDQGELIFKNQNGELQQFCYGEVSCRLAE